MYDHQSGQNFFFLQFWPILDNFGRFWSIEANFRWFEEFKILVIHMGFWLMSFWIQVFDLWVAWQKFNLPHLAVRWTWKESRTIQVSKSGFFESSESRINSTLGIWWSHLCRIWQKDASWRVSNKCSWFCCRRFDHLTSCDLSWPYFTSKLPFYLDPFGPFFDHPLNDKSLETYGVYSILKQKAFDGDISRASICMNFQL